MAFRLASEQEELVSVLQRLLADRAGSWTADCAAGAPWPNAEAWEALAALGLPLLLMPGDAGGIGGTCLDAALCCVELGAACVPGPTLGGLFLAPLAIDLAGPNAPPEWTAMLAAPSTRPIFAMPGLAAGYDDLACDGLTISGTLPPLPEAPGATHLCLIEDNGRLALIELGDGRSEIVPQPSLDRTRPLAGIRLDRARLVGERTVALERDAMQRLLDTGRVLVAAEQFGAARRMLDQAIAYSRVRRQFGRTIGSFQGLKHHLADLAARLVPCEALIWYAAQLIDDRDPQASAACCHAKAHVAEVTRDVANGAVQAHGAYGFTQGSGLDLPFRRIAANRALFGSPELCRTLA